MTEHDAPKPPPKSVRLSTLWPLLGIGALVLIASLIVPGVMRILRPTPSQASLVQAKRIYQACQAHAAIRGKLPAALGDLVPDFLPDRQSLADPQHPEHGLPGYLYFASGAAGTEPPETVFLASKGAAKDYRVVVRFDGQARLQFLPEKWLRR